MRFFHAREFYSQRLCADFDNFSRLVFAHAFVVFSRLDLDLVADLKTLLRICEQSGQHIVEVRGDGIHDAKRERVFGKKPAAVEGFFGELRASGAELRAAA